MKLLAIDSAGAACSAAVWDGDGVAARRFEAMDRGHAERLMPMVRAVMDEASGSEAGPGAFEALDGIAVTVGPGAFTGVRIGLAAARAIGLAAALPVTGFTTLEVVAAAQRPHAWPILVALESKRADKYVQLFGEDLAPLSAPAAVLPRDLASILPLPPAAVCGDAATPVAAALADAGWRTPALDGPDLSDAAVLAGLAGARWREIMRQGAPSMPRPLYLRPPDATRPAAAR